MKKLIIAALAIAAMAACTKSNVQFDQPGEIAFQPVAQKATKAAVVGTNYPTDAAYNFNVWAWWAEAGKTDIADFQTAYIDDQPFEYRSEKQLWGGSGQSYYWPTTGSLYFAGYSPASIQGSDDNSDDCEVSYDKNSMTLTVKNYRQSTNISETVDLMWFHLTDVSYDRTTQQVPVKFHHALSWLTFRANLTDVTTPQLWTVKSITLKNVETMANFTAKKDITADNHGITSWASHSSTENITVFTGSYNVKYVDADYAPGADDDSILENTGKDNGVLVIPQGCTLEEAQLVIEFDQRAPSGKTVSQTKTLKLGSEWLPSKHYLYTITFSAEEIYISPKVVEWTEVYDLAVPVE